MPNPIYIILTDILSVKQSLLYIHKIHNISDCCQKHFLTLINFTIQRILIHIIMTCFWCIYRKYDKQIFVVLYFWKGWYWYGEFFNICLLFWNIEWVLKYSFGLQISALAERLELSYWDLSYGGTLYIYTTYSWSLKKRGCRTNFIVIQWLIVIFMNMNSWIHMVTFWKICYAHAAASYFLWELYTRLWFLFFFGKKFSKSLQLTKYKIHYINTGKKIHSSKLKISSIIF